MLLYLTNRFFFLFHRHQLLLLVTSDTIHVSFYATVFFFSSHLTRIDCIQRRKQIKLFTADGWIEVDHRILLKSTMVGSHIGRTGMWILWNSYRYISLGIVWNLFQFQLLSAHSLSTRPTFIGYMVCRFIWQLSYAIREVLTRSAWLLYLHSVYVKTYFIRQDVRFAKNGYRTYLGTCHRLHPIMQSTQNHNILLIKLELWVVEYKYHK